MLSLDATKASIAQDKRGRKKRKASGVVAAPAAPLRHAFLDHKLVSELSLGHSWAALDSYGVPFSTPLEVDEFCARYVSSPVLLFSKLNKIIFGYSDPTNISLDNENN